MPVQSGEQTLERSASACSTFYELRALGAIREIARNGQSQLELDVLIWDDRRPERYRSRAGCSVRLLGALARLAADQLGLTATQRKDIQ